MLLRGGIRVVALVEDGARTVDIYMNACDRYHPQSGILISR